jgi:hypothetical protein
MAHDRARHDCEADEMISDWLDDMRHFHGGVVFLFHSGRSVGVLDDRID